jgi:ribosomal protein L29
MDLQKISIGDMRTFDAARLRETEDLLRRELASMRLDVYTSGTKSAAKKRGLKKNLARLMTVTTEKTSESKK